jgi:hypothetical protein
MFYKIYVFSLSFFLFGVSNHFFSLLIFSLFIYRGDEISIDREIVYMAIELWLLYIQPWNYSSTSSSSSSSSGTSDKKGLERHWKNYIANHYHFYSTVFVYFIRMTSKMNISLINHIDPYSGRTSSSSSSSSSSTISAEGNRNLLMLEKVMKVFSPNLIAIIEDLGRSYVQWYSNSLSEENHSPTLRGKFTRSSSNNAFPRLLHHHHNSQSSFLQNDENSHPTASADNAFSIAMVLMKDHVSFY